MKTKQEQIAEMAKERNEMKDMMKLLDKCVSLNPMYKSEVASVLYGNNYRKLPEDSVVLSREEYEMLKSLYDTQKGAIMTSSVGDLPLQEQIEEITKLIQAEYKQWLDVTGVIPEGTTYYAECMGCAIDSAEALYNAGYRKTFTRDLASDMQKAFKEGYEKGCEACAQSWDNGYNDGFEDGKEQAYKDCYDITRKETAKEILSRIKLYATGSKTDLIVLIDEIAKANGVEVKE